MKTFMEFNSLEHEKGQDFFSTDHGLFLSFLLENVGPALTGVFQPHIESLVSSPEETGDCGGRGDQEGQKGPGVGVTLGGSHY